MNSNINNNGSRQPKKGTSLWMILVPVIIGALLITGVGAYFLLCSSKPAPVEFVDDEDEDEGFSVRFTGYVDQYPVNMRLQVEGNLVTGEYYYESQGPEKKLLLSGTYRNGDVDLNETTVEGQPTGHFRGHLTRRQFEGEFINSRGESMWFNLYK